jgi:SAM-dependent methyltransferase
VTSSSVGARGWSVVALYAASVLAAGAGAWIVLGSPVALAIATVLAASIVLATSRWGTWGDDLLAHGAACGEAVDRLVAGRPGPWIALAAAASLCGELLLIRWHAVSFQLFSYFKNVSLLACFLGLGIGYARAAARPLLVSLALPAVALQVVGLRLLSLSPAQAQLQNPVSEQLALGLLDDRTLGHWLLTYGVLTGVFMLTVLTCVPLGQLAGRAMLALPALPGYGWNLAGSLLAVAAFTLLSEAWSPPETWMLALAATVLPFLLSGAPSLAGQTSLLALGLAFATLAIDRPGAVDFYSPYQLITLRLRPVALAVESSHSYFQTIWDLRPTVPRVGEFAQVAAYYDLPYAFAPRPARVLVVGSGAGNDVAAALRAGASGVDAVEIDPVVLDLGRHLHPERPYGDPRVRAVVTDARAFVRRSSERYDLIVFGLLDAHAALAGASSVRLDSYVYTVEALREAGARLKDDGVLVMSFTLLSREIAWKLLLMTREAFGGEPRVFETRYDGGLTFVAGPGLERRASPALPFPEVTSAMREAGLRADVSTDDWPFLYMPVRSYPRSYLFMAALLLGVCVLVLRAALPASASGLGLTPFALGAGFMLLETKAITELALVFGSTWQVVSAVIAGVLMMAFAANLWVARIGPPRTVLVYGLLGASVLAGYLARPTSWGLGPTLEPIAATALATLPLLFAGAAFSRELAREGTAAQVLASNLLGAILGGLLEYNVLYVGVRSLGLLALALYGLAFVSALRRP